MLQLEDCDQMKFRILLFKGKAKLNLLCGFQSNKGLIDPTD